MRGWAEVVSHPLGLAGFALFVVFWILGRWGAGANRWLAPAGVAMAFIALLGGLALAYRQVSSPLQSPAPSELRIAPAAPTPDREVLAVPGAALPATPPAAPQPPPSKLPAVSKVEQHTSGAQSPAVAGVNGNVTISIDSPGSQRK